jgi:FkbM family methyltransferase
MSATAARAELRHRSRRAAERARTGSRRARHSLRRQAPGLSRWMVRTADHGRALVLRRWPAPPARPLERVVHAYARSEPHATFVQVGAHDGSVLDPLRRALLCTSWTGVLVEPVPYVFARLEERYGGRPGLHLENVAISHHEGTMPFHHLPETGGLWYCYDALGSFRREVVVSHAAFVPDIEERLVTVDVPCAPLAEVCRRNGVERPQVVQIDTEGYDLEVLRGIDFDAHRPTLVMFEHLHLDAGERAEAKDLLEVRGYSLASDGMDTVALLLDQVTSPVRAEHAAAVAAGARYAL